MSKQQEQLEAVDKEKSQLLAQRDESTKLKSKKITETGQILMTIDNLYQKCEQMKDIMPPKKNVTSFEKVKDFNNTQLSGEKANEQLIVIIQCFQNSKMLEKQYSQQAKLKKEEKK